MRMKFRIVSQCLCFEAEATFFLSGLLLIRWFSREAPREYASLEEVTWTKGAWSDGSDGSDAVNAEWVFTVAT